MKRNQPDLMLVLAMLFSLGLALSAYTHANREDKVSTTTVAVVAQP